MKTVSLTELRNRASEILDLVEKGESIRVLRHRRPIAKIVPAGLREAKSRLEAPRPASGGATSVPQQGRVGGKAASLGLRVKELPGG